MGWGEVEIVVLVCEGVQKADPASESRRGRVEVPALAGASGQEA